MTMKRTLKNDSKKRKVQQPNPKPLKPQKDTTDEFSVEKKAIDVDETESVATDNSSVAKSDVLSLVERLAQKKGNTNFLGE